MRSRAFWVEQPGEGRIRTRTLAPRSPGHVRIGAAWSGISRGTERTVFHGRVPPAVAAAMRAPFQDGDFPGPVKYGYASVGLVIEGPEDGPAPGTAVFALFPHQDRYDVPVDSVRVLPGDVPLRRAVLGANCETALNAVWDAGIGPGDHVVVVGAGVVGCLVAWLAGGVPGTRVTLVDVQPGRAGVVEALGVRFAEPADAPTDQDVVVHTSGTAAGLATALATAGDEATVLELSWYGVDPVAVTLGTGFHHRRLQLRSSQVGGLPPARRPRWTYARRLDAALSLLTDPRLDVLLEPDVPFDQLPARMPELLGPSGGLCHPIRYPPLSDTELP